MFLSLCLVHAVSPVARVKLQLVCQQRNLTLYYGYQTSLWMLSVRNKCGITKEKCIPDIKFKNVRGNQHLSFLQQAQVQKNGVMSHIIAYA